MTGTMDDEKIEYTITWLIENYSYSTNKTNEALYSPAFTADGLENTVWSIELFPRGSDDDYNDHISVFLYRGDDDGPESITLKCELSFLDEDGSPLISKDCGEYAFTKENGYGFNQFCEIDKVNCKMDEYLPGDILSIRCKFWRGEGNLKQGKQVSVRSRFHIKQISFLHVIEDFSSLELNQSQTIQIQYNSDDECALESSVYISDCSCSDEKIILEISPSDAEQILSKCKIYLLDTNGTVMKCGGADNRSDSERKGIQELPLCLTRQVILKRKSKFLTDDKLSLLCDCIFSFGVEYHKIEKIWHEIPSYALDQINNNQNENIYNLDKKLSKCPLYLDEFKAVYDNQLFTDMEIKTKTKSFPVHKIVLCARSPVFKSMMTDDMKEKNTSCIEIVDLEDDVVEEFLSFLYSENLEKAKWETMLKLYYAADKYAVEKLKVMCSYSLICSLSVSSVSELLVVADAHNDADLHKAVLDFIFKHEKQVYSSDEWEHLVETNPLLVSKTMLLNYKRKMLMN